jgi:hypothetical protein
MAGSAVLPKRPQGGDRCPQAQFKEHICFLTPARAEHLVAATFVAPAGIATIGWAGVQN